MEGKMFDLLDKICECQAMCRICFNECLEEENIRMMKKCIKLDIECAEVCALAMASITYEGDFTDEVLQLCIHACEACAEECGKHSYEHCLNCAQSCRECADACRQYATELRQFAA